MCSAGTLGRRASCGWLNGDAVVQRRERPSYTAQTILLVVGRLAVKTTAELVRDRICHIEPVPSAAQNGGAVSKNHLLFSQQSFVHHTSIFIVKQP